MFVQSAAFVQRHQKSATRELTVRNLELVRLVHIEADSSRDA